MKYVIIELNHLNETLMFSNSILNNYFFDAFFGEFEAKTQEATESYTQYEDLLCTQTVELNCTIVNHNKNSFIESKSSNIVLETIYQNIYFDDSNRKESAGVGSILMDWKGNKILMDIHLEFLCTNKTTETRHSYKV